jgi:predicted nucleic-acid-binding protein
VRTAADTNVLVRAAVMDVPVQGAIAAEMLLEAGAVAVTLPSLCEFVWALTRGYKKGANEVAGAVRALIESASVLADRPAAEAGLAMLEGEAFSPTASSPSRAGGREAAFL